MDDLITSEHIDRLLRSKFSGDQYAVFSEVRNGTGFLSRAETIDLVVFNLWPSGGLTRSAFEIKISRGDFLRELANPHKNQDARAYYHEFWYVAPKTVIESTAELPENTGWLEVQKGRLVTRRAAMRRENPPMDDLLLASLCRAMISERDRSVREKMDTVRTSDPYVARCIRVAAVVEKFLCDRHLYVNNATTDEQLKEYLATAVTDEETRQRQYQIERANNNLQNELLDVWVALTVACTVGILEVDEQNQFMMSAWGGNDKAFGIAAKRILAKTAPKFDRAAHNRFLEQFDLLLKCASKLNRGNNDPHSR